MSVRLRLILVSLIAIIIAIYINITFVTKEYRANFEGLLLERGEIASLELERQINRLLKIGLYIDEFSGFDKHLNEIVIHDATIRHISIIHLYGKLLYESSVNGDYSTLATEITKKGNNAQISRQTLNITRPVGDPAVANIVVILDMDAIDQEISKLEATLLQYHFLAIFIGISLLFVLLWHQFNKPINLLLKDIQETKLVDIKKTPSNLTSRKDEIGIIAKTFETLMNGLSDSQSLLMKTNEDLEEHKKNLELLVAKRTAQIKKVNRELVKDIERRKLLEEKLEKMAHTDPLTGLPNRRILEQYIEDIVSQSEKTNSKFAFIYIDIDEFKKINDEFSHDTGDAALKALAESFSETKKNNEYFARLGGDEFCLIVTDYKDKSDLEEIASRLINVNAPGISVSGVRLGLKISIGIAIFPDNGKCFRELRAESDLAMFNVKKHLKGHFSFA